MYDLRLNPMNETELLICFNGQIKLRLQLNDWESDEKAKSYADNLIEILNNIK